MNLSMNRNRFEDRLVVVGGSDRWRVWDQHMQTITYRMDQQQGPTVYNTGNYIQYPVVNHDGKEYEKKCIYICVCY